MTGDEDTKQQADTQKAMSRYVQFMVRAEDGTERPMFDSSDGTVTLCSRDGDAPIHLKPLRLNLPPLNLQRGAPTGSRRGRRRPKLNGVPPKHP
jgi:hypothetical protein